MYGYQLLSENEDESLPFRCILAIERVRIELELELSSSIKALRNGAGAELAYALVELNLRNVTFTTKIYNYF